MGSRKRMSQNGYLVDAGHAHRTSTSKESLQVTLAYFYGLFTGYDHLRLRYCCQTNKAGWNQSKRLYE